ncbi:GPRNNA21 family protein [Megaselia abdita]
MRLDLGSLQLYGINLEALTKGAIITILAIAIVLSNLLIIATYVNFKGPSEIINNYLLSLAVADLLCGLLIVPFSIYPAIAGDWIYSDILCRFTGYLEVTLWSISVYTFMWISVDRYLAVRKPLRYETVQTKTRCQCWMAFTWISAGLLCCPPLLGYSVPLYNKEAYVCMLDWGNMAAYSVTLGILVLGPSIISIVHNYGYILSMMRRLKSGEPIHDKEYATALAENLANPSHMMSFVLVFAFWASWLPLIFVRIYQGITGYVIQNSMVNFGLVWIGVLNSFWKIVIMTSMSPEFRIALRVFCLTICCKTKGRLQAELIGLDPDDWSR